jgi:hypothetical protein
MKQGLHEFLRLSFQAKSDALIPAFYLQWDIDLSFGIMYSVDSSMSASVSCFT